MIYLLKIYFFCKMKNKHEKKVYKMILYETNTLVSENHGR